MLCFIDKVQIETTWTRNLYSSQGCYATGRTFGFHVAVPSVCLQYDLDSHYRWSDKVIIDSWGNKLNTVCVQCINRYRMLQVLWLTIYSHFMDLHVLNKYEECVKVILTGTHYFNTIWAAIEHLVVNRPTPEGWQTLGFVWLQPCLKPRWANHLGCLYWHKGPTPQLNPISEIPIRYMSLPSHYTPNRGWKPLRQSSP